MPTKKEIKKAKKVLAAWETRVDVMGYFEMPENYAANKETGKYARFTGYLKQLITETLTSEEANLPLSGKNGNEYRFPENWWKVAMQIGNGKNVENTLPSLGEIVDDDDAAKVLDAFLPAYRALTEKFEKRSPIQWLFNHSQYTAERDSIRALRGVMMSLLGCDREEIDARLKEYQTNIPDSGRDEDQREAESDQYKINMKLMRMAIKQAAKSGISPQEWLDIQNGVHEQKEFEKVDQRNYEWNAKNKGYTDFVDINVDDVRESANVSQEEIEDGRDIDDMNKSFKIESDEDVKKFEREIKKI